MMFDWLKVWEEHCKTFCKKSAVSSISPLYRYKWFRIVTSMDSKHFTVVHIEFLLLDKEFNFFIRYAMVFKVCVCSSERGTSGTSWLATFHSSVLEARYSVNVLGTHFFFSDQTTKIISQLIIQILANLVFHLSLFKDNQLWVLPILCLASQH